MIKRWLKRLVEFLFDDYLQELKKINQNLVVLRYVILAEQHPETLIKRGEMLSALGPLKPLSGDKPSIFPGA